MRERKNNLEAAVVFVSLGFGCELKSQDQHNVASYIGSSPTLGCVTVHLTDLIIMLIRSWHLVERKGTKLFTYIGS